MVTRVDESESWESRFFLEVGVRVGVEKLCLPESRVGVEKIRLPESRVGVEKICSTLTPNLSQEWKAFYAMNKLSKRIFGLNLSKSMPASVLQISGGELAFLTSKCSKQSSSF